MSRWEVSGAYSPLKHVLVRGALGNRSAHGDSSYWRTRQYELTAGAYWAPRHWTLGVLGGYGRGLNEARYLNDGGPVTIFANPVQHQYEARFRRLFGEAYVVYDVSSRFSLGVACRSTRLYYTTLTDLGTPIDLRQLTRVEPMLLLRFGVGSLLQNAPPVQLQVSVGGSGTMGPGSRHPYDPDGSRRQLRYGRSYVAVGIGILPHRLAALWRQP
ncbi:hypothetical protein [Hymenobacter psychrotolerans]|uniref:hypothetical protein n=1 Tax=Hymenobacter psychrotolerans TaxID=344998 RepID=UPI001114F42F|nr:hypothetical protein [Hymenobacter psychrotolerans]